ncbi:MAG: hypothetical protein U0905_09600 [Pirellulales bacterium]
MKQWKTGTILKTLVAAGALANARTFGGQDYIGFHTFMALALCIPYVKIAQCRLGRTTGAQGIASQHSSHS